MNLPSLATARTWAYSLADRIFPVVTVFYLFAATIPIVLLSTYVATFTYYGVNLLVEVNMTAALLSAVTLLARLVRAEQQDDDADAASQPKLVRAILASVTGCARFMLLILKFAWILSLPVAFLLGVNLHPAVAVSVAVWCAIWLLPVATSPHTPKPDSNN